MQPIITLDYCSGGLRTAQLIEEILVPAFSNTALAELGDGAVCHRLKARRSFHLTALSSAPGGSRAGISENLQSAVRSTTFAWLAAYPGI